MKLKAITKQLVTMLAVTAGLSLAGSTQAQYITGGQYLQNATTGGGYGGWASATYNYTATGIEVQTPDITDYGGAYFVINSGTQTLSTSDTEVQLTFTVNGNPANYAWFSPGQLVLNDYETPSYMNMGYTGYNNNNPIGWLAGETIVWNGTTATLTLPLLAQQVADIQAGNCAIQAFSLDFDPSTINAGPIDITYNSIQLIPEPATVTLVGLGLLGLLGLRRRHTS
jgi:hypothetical protein